MTTENPHDILRELEDDVSRWRKRAPHFHRAADAFEASNQSEAAANARTEARAFELYGSHQGGAFAGYFQPVVVITDGVTDPPKDFFTTERLEYLAGRALTSSNPIHSARYADVVWDLAPKKDPEMGRLAAQKYLECSGVYKSNLWDREFEQSVKRAARLASMMRDERLIPLVRSQILSQLRELGQAQDYEPCLDLAQALAGASRIELGEEELQEILDVLTNASDYYRSSHPQRADALGTGAGPDELLVRRTEETKMEVGQRAGLVDRNAGRLEIARSLERQGNGRFEESSIAALSFYSQAYDTFLDLNSSQDLDRIRVKLRHAGAGMEEESTELTFEGSIERSTLEEGTRDLFSDTLEDTLKMIAGARSLVPSLEDARLGVEERRRQTPLLSSIPQLRLAGGYLTARFAEPDEIEDKLLADQVLTWVEIFSVVRQYVFEKLRSDYALDAAALGAYFRSGGVFGEENVALIEHGLGLYLSGDYVSALHVLAPRFEALLRDILESVDLPVADPAKGGTFTLGTLLNNEELRQAAGTDLMAYYEYVLRRPDRGLNLRNRITHGTLERDMMHRGTTELVLHLLLTLTRFYRYPLESEEVQSG